ncbi:amidohydrolase [Labrys okinawensis]|uniref:Amidohydrolase n=1 Tax=Labrys okinawensis TaxID=346911 RepID=A0A2S9Q5Z8_9HYPH|nr:nitrilase-related carbon-nitrogen hydrolase [Labrys okinawensis]PRH84771.1 amidohydrolase [Labrys okinawensis]
MPILHKVAAVQFEPTMFEKDRNITGLIGLVTEAAKAGARLIVTPEMGTTGYCWFDRAEVAPFVETVPGATTACFETVARTHDCYIVIGMPEVEPSSGLYYNTAVLIGPEGVIGKHRKTHPYIAEPKWSAPGNLGHQVFETPIGRIALLICMDIHFIETARIVALKGADVICHVSNWLAERTPAPYWISRAFENGCYLIESNRWGLERTVQFSGGSCVIEPDGSIAAVIDAGDGIAYATIDLELARDPSVLGRRVLEQRRPDLYKELPTTTYAWNPLDFFGLYAHRPLPPGRKSRVAVAQFSPTDDVGENLARIEEMVVAATRDRDADLIVFPERSITGLGQGLAESLSGPAVERLLSIAARENIYIVAGMAESADGRVHNTAVLAGPEGLIGSYRQIHPTSEDRNWATPGEDWRVFDTPLGRLGLLIGHDAMFPEAARILSLRGCDLIACPAAMRERFYASHPGSAIHQNYPIPTGATPDHWHHFRVRAGENNVFFAFANIADELNGFPGRSGIFGPDTFEFPRREAHAGPGTSLASVNIDTSNLDTRYPTNVVRRKDMMAMRLPHHYLDLI